MRPARIPAHWYATAAGSLLGFGLIVWLSRKPPRSAQVADARRAVADHRPDPVRSAPLPPLPQFAAPAPLSDVEEMRQIELDPYLREQVELIEGFRRATDDAQLGADVFRRML